MLRAFLLAGLLASALATVAAPARAQCRLCDNPTTTREEESQKGEIQIEVETSLSFDRLILYGEGSGSALLRPDGSRSANGAVAEIGPRAMVGTVVLHGQPDRFVRIDLPRRIVLYSLSGGQLTFDEVASDLPAMPRLDSAGNLTFRFGGRLTVSGDADGDYRGDLPIVAEYL